MNNSNLSGEVINATALSAGSVSVASATFLGYAVPFTTYLALDVYVISFLTTSFVVLINKYFSNQTEIKALRSEMKELRKKQIKVLKEKDQKKIEEIQKQMMEKSMQNMKHAWNPKIMLITMVPMILVFGALRSTYGGFGEFLNLGFTQFGWFGTYFLFSIINSIILRKVFNVA